MLEYILYQKIKYDTSLMNTKRRTRHVVCDQGLEFLYKTVQQEFVRNSKCKA